ncbi:pilus assembly protein CpaE [Meinhardsimonia xiamenensis]|jgi:pilus assembly protein CpaE|uniref:Pilus assembly protein CpaE n=1 Tax=Meinhardsimonia xiamenensis TaxID=990712 RepID=A0A1G9CME4_9RHOB|nr:AAA family ATPase [Meinhardsimonia xiamenensis]PRX38308.1 pilus assembly protein CpaE [Meinhardsimonia xiamenensis]SDK52860.1 pilus assembly protein CpaE [Meinhardsimonia xiamenensis]
MSVAASDNRAAPEIKACTISRDVQKFDLLIEDMEAELGEAWGDITIEEARAFLSQPEARRLEFVAIAIDDQDEENLAMVADVILAAEEAGVDVILIAEEVSPIALHQLLRLGAKEFVPYPLPEGALHEAIERLRAPAPAAVAAFPAAPAAARANRDGVVIAVHGIAGGVGATTFAVNLAWELACLEGTPPPKVCLIDLDLQFGSVATYLDLPRREAVFELLSDTAAMDADAFSAALTVFQDRLSVLTTPTDVVPLDIITSEDVERVIEMARSLFDYVVIDMPTTLVQWTEAVLSGAHVYFTPVELDMRSAQNVLRLVRALKQEELPYEKLRFVLNRAPKFTDLTGKGRVKRMAESLEIALEVQLPDGGKPVTQSCDHGLPLAETAAKNPLRKEIQKLARQLHAHHMAETDKAA